MADDPSRRGTMRTVQPPRPLPPLGFENCRVALAPRRRRGWLPLLLSLLGILAGYLLMILVLLPWLRGTL